MVVYTIALIVHVIISVALVFVILSQTSKGGLDANLGGAAMNVFGGSGASKFLRKWTQILALLFVISCVFLAFQVKAAGQRRAPSVLEQEFGTSEAAPAEQPGTGEDPAPQPAGLPQE
jgi:preprotein translocase subunit SecG